jgi:hypothetical protein
VSSRTTAAKGAGFTTQWTIGLERVHSSGKQMSNHACRRTIILSRSNAGRNVATSTLCKRSFQVENPQAQSDHQYRCVSRRLFPSYSGPNPLKVFIYTISNTGVKCSGVTRQSEIKGDTSAMLGDCTFVPHNIQDPKCNAQNIRQAP